MNNRYRMSLYNAGIAEKPLLRNALQADRYAYTQ